MQTQTSANSQQPAANSLPKPLTIANHNNKLATECFIVIDKSPGRENVPMHHILAQRLYSATHEGEQIFVKIIDLLFAPLGKLTDHFTFWGNGINATQYKEQFKKLHPAATDETEMIIYYYQRAKE